MLNLGSFTIVSSRDVSTSDTSGSESDCDSEGSHWQIESDCACPADGFTLNQAQFISNQSLPYTIPSLYLDQLDADSYIAFNITGYAGVVLINRPVYTLLEAFHQPCSLEEGVRIVNSPPFGLEIVHHLVELGLLQPAGVRPRIRTAAPQTLTAWLHVTNDCNLRCSYCYVNKTPDEMEVEHGLQAVEAVFRSAMSHGFEAVKLKFAGGEATLNFPVALALFDQARHLAKEFSLGLEGVVLSNGVALSRRMMRELKARDLRLMISLDGIGSAHDSQRPFVNRRGSFLYVERSLDNLAEEGLTPSISVTVSNRNLSGLPETVSYLLDRHLPFTINFYRENDCSVELKDLSYQDEALIATYRAAFAVIQERLPRYSLLDVLVDRARLDVPHDRPCGVGHSYLVIDQGGGVASCHMAMGKMITDVTNSDPLRTVMESHQGIQNLSVDEKEGCRECFWRYWCAGGCPALTYRVMGRFDVKSPNCRIYRALFPEVLRLEGLRLMKYSSIN